MGILSMNVVVFTLSTLIIIVICGILRVYLYILAKQGKSCDAKLRGPKSFLIHGSQLHRSGYIYARFLLLTSQEAAFFVFISLCIEGHHATCIASDKMNRRGIHI